MATKRPNPIPNPQEESRCRRQGLLCSGCYDSMAPLQKVVSWVEKKKEGINGECQSILSGTDETKIQQY